MHLSESPDWQSELLEGSYQSLTVNYDLMIN